jgi:hypothetical protein
MKLDQSYSDDVLPHSDFFLHVSSLPMAYFRYIAQLLHVTDSSEFLKNITGEFKGTVTLILGLDKEVWIGRS